MKKRCELKNFLVSARKLINKIPRFNSKFSNKIYDNHQKMIILIFRQKMRMTYRGIVKFFRFSGLARALLKLKNVPDHSTLVKFHKRIKSKVLDSLLCKKKIRTAAIDASGFETSHMSYHYANAWNRSEEHTSELQSHSFTSYAVFCLKKKHTYFFFFILLHSFMFLNLYLP